MKTKILAQPLNWQIFRAQTSSVASLEIEARTRYKYTCPRRTALWGFSTNLV